MTKRLTLTFLGLVILAYIVYCTRELQLVYEDELQFEPQVLLQSNTCMELSDKLDTCLIQTQYSLPLHPGDSKKRSAYEFRKMLLKLREGYERIELDFSRLLNDCWTRDGKLSVADCDEWRDKAILCQEVCE